MTPPQGPKLLNDPTTNKGSAFTEKERDLNGLHGLLPYSISTIEQQVNRRYANFLSKPTDIAKYLFLSSLKHRNETLFYRLVLEHVNEMLPLIYTPTVGEASQDYSSLYQEPSGLYLSYPLKERMEEMINNYPVDEVDVIVVTDGERILGLGDLGVGGMVIPEGKLALYTLFGGVHPSRALPVMLDVGTNNEKLLQDSLYLGWRHQRIHGQEYSAFIDSFVEAATKRYPNVLIQWEDFSGVHARPILEKYRERVCSFNDDIQGTAAVVLSAILSAVKASDKKLREQRIALLGAGAAGIGICSEILSALKQEGVEEEEALNCFYLVDLHGLIHTGQNHIPEHQKRFARREAELASWRVEDRNRITLHEVVQNAKPTVLIGVSTQKGAFTEEIVREMAAHTERPIILPLSNPISRCEASPYDLIRWTEGKAIIASGSPFKSVTYDNRLFPVAQCNNVYIFPGVGLGVIASSAKQVTDKMFLSAAQVLSNHSPMLQDAQGLLFPSFENLREISRKIAFAVGQTAQEEGVAPKTTSVQLEALIEEKMWYPAYSTLRVQQEPFHS